MSLKAALNQIGQKSHFDWSRPSFWILLELTWASGICLTIGFISSKTTVEDAYPPDMGEIGFFQLLHLPKHDLWQRSGKPALSKLIEQAPLHVNTEIIVMPRHDQSDKSCDKSHALARSSLSPSLIIIRFR